MNFTRYLPEDMCGWIDLNAKSASDITLISEKNMYITVNGINIISPFYVSDNDLKRIVERLCGGSIYANQNTLKYGYITDENGCRVGVCGTSIYDEDNKPKFLRDITAVNIRVARDVKGASDDVIGYIFDGKKVKNTLIVSPPSAGKTTLLRDIARSLGNSLRVGILDEREEIAKSDDMGRFTFCVKGCGKYDGILNMLRSMAPEVIITDEIGTEDDEIAIEKLIDSGCKIVCSAHGYDEKDILRRSTFKRLVDERIFERIIVLSKRNGVGTVEKII